MIRLHQRHVGSGAHSAGRGVHSADIDSENSLQSQSLALPETPKRLAAAVLDSLAAQIAIVDETGTIVVVNRAWNDFAAANGADRDAVSPGTNYLHVCDLAEGPGADEAAAIAAGIRDVLAGRIETFELEYPCHSPQRWRWCAGRVTRLRDTGPPHAVIAHEDITPRKLAEHERVRFQEHLKQRLGRTKALRRVDASITTGRDPRYTLGLVVEQAIDQLGVDAADILLLDEKTNTLELAAARNIAHDGGSQAGSGSMTLARRVVSVGLPLHIANLTDALTGDSRVALLRDKGLKAYHGIPLLADGKVKGVLECFHRNAVDTDAEWLEFAEILAAQAAIAIVNARLLDGLRRSNDNLRAAYDSTIEGWARALDLRDHETEGHSRRVMDMAIRLAEAMGMSQTDLVHMRRGALLHDIGKLGIPDAILRKPGELTEEESSIMRRHTDHAVEILSPIEFLVPALDIPRFHHERWDGTGYPSGLKGAQIPLAARIFAAVDVWDALGHDRPYRQAWPPGACRTIFARRLGPISIHAWSRLS